MKLKDLIDNNLTKEEMLNIDVYPKIWIEEIREKHKEEERGRRKNCWVWLVGRFRSERRLFGLKTALRVTFFKNLPHYILID